MAAVDRSSPFEIALSLVEMVVIGYEDSIQVCEMYRGGLLACTHGQFVVYPRRGVEAILYGLD